MARKGFKDLALLALAESPWLLKLATPLARVTAVRDSAAWDAEYQSGKWGFLTSAAEDAHHQLIASYAHSLRPQARLLDVGCGEGVLNTALRRFGYRRYLGIDISPAAIATAQQRADANTTFAATPGGGFVTDERFDVIVINEALYYFTDPLATAERFARFLDADGILVISMAMVGLRHSLARLRIWEDLKRRFEVIDAMAIHRPAGATWVVKALKPRATR